MPKHDLVRIYTDGGARGNPGPAAIGVVLCDEADRVLQEEKQYIGKGTNNDAEYRAVIRGLELAASYSPRDVLVVSDSELVVRQLTGVYRVRNDRIAKRFEEVRRLERGFRKVSFEYRPRLTGHLARSDALVNEALDAAEG